MLSSTPLAVVPVLAGPLQVLIAILPAIFVAAFGVAVSLLRPRVAWAGVRLLWRLKVPLGIVAVSSAGLVWAARAVWPEAARVAREGDIEGDWPVFRGGPDRRGSVAGARGPVRGGIVWRFHEGGEAYFSSPAVAGERVYIASAEVSPFSESGAIHCFELESGALLWRAAPADYRPTFSSPVVSGRYLVCGEGLHFTENARVVCLDLTPGREGTLVWELRTASHVECTPVIHGGRVYVGAGEDGYYAVELEPDAAGRPRVVWHLPGERYPDAETSLAAWDDKLVAGLGVGGKAVCILDAASGAELARIATPYPVFSPPAIADGKAYIGMGNGDYVHTAEEVRELELERVRESGASASELDEAMRGLGPAGEVWCIDLESFEVLWKYPVGRTVLGAVALAPDSLYFGSRDGFLYRLRRDGTLLGRWNAHAPLIASPALAGEHVYVVSSSGTLTGVDRRTLEPAWDVAIGTEPLFISSPVVAGGHVLAGTQHDGFVAAGLPGGERREALWPGHLGGPGVAGNARGSELPDSCELLWSFPASGKEPVAGTVRAPVAIWEEDVYVPLAGSGEDRGMACFAVESSEVAEPRLRWRFPSPLPVLLSPAVSGDLVVAVDGRRGDAARRLRAIDRETGKLRWELPVLANASGVFSVSSAIVVIARVRDALSAIDLATGRVLWDVPAGGIEHAAAITEAILVAAVAEPASLVALDRPTGRLLWRVPLDSRPVGSPVVARAVVYAGTASRLEARSLVDGSPLSGWDPPAEGVSADVSLGPERITYVGVSGKLLVLERSRGRVLHEAPGALPGMAPLVTRDEVLFFVEDALARLRFDAETGESWADTRELGRPTAPMVLSVSGIYAGMSRGGLVRFGAGGQ